MAETSAMWNGTTVGDATTYAAAYCSDEVARYQRSLTCLADRSLQGPVYSLEAAYNGQLEVTNTGGLSIQTDTGRAIVNGWVYESTAQEGFVAALGDGFYRMVLRNSSGAATQTIRQVLKYNAISTPTLTQSGSTWEIPLANFEVSGGAITAAGIVDERDFVNAATHQELIPYHIGWNVTGAAALGIDSSLDGLMMVDAAQTVVKAFWRVPDNFISGLDYTPVFIQATAAANGDVRFNDATIIHGACGGAQTTDSVGPITETINTSFPSSTYRCITNLTVTATSPDPGDIVEFSVQRIATADPPDTLSATLYAFGARVEYFGYRR